MEIEFTHQYTTGSGKVYLVGDIEHVENSVAAKLLFEGVAKRPVYKSFKEAMDAKEKHRQATLTKPDPSGVVGVLWGVIDLQSIQPPHAAIRRQWQHETLYGDDKAFSDVPQNILQRYYELTNATDPEILAERRIQEQARQQAEEQKRRQADAGAMAVMGVFRRG